MEECKCEGTISRGVGYSAASSAADLAAMLKRGVSSPAGPACIMTANLGPVALTHL